MEVPGGHDHKIRVCLYELIGTSVLTYAAITSGGNILAVAFTLFLLINVNGPITGSHFNPAVTTAVYTYNKNYGKDLLFYIMIVASQFAGGLLGVGWSWLVLASGEDNKIPAEYQPILCPNDLNKECDSSYDWTRSAIFFQLFGTFIFMFIICMVKNDTTAPSKDGTICAMLVALTLLT